MDQTHEPFVETPLQKLLASGAGATGVAVGGVTGFLIGGPVGSALGGAAGALLQDGMRGVTSQIAERVDTRTERERIGSCLILAHELIAERLNAGQPLREASFFNRRTRRTHGDLRSEAEELLEGTFLAARDSYEQQKVELLARFYANAAFETTLDASHLNHLLAIAKSLTYRQLVIIGILGSFETTSVRQYNYREGAELPTQVIGVLYEIFHLATLDLVVSSDTHYILGVADINPSTLRLQGNGAHIFNLLQPDRVPESDRAFFFAALSS